MPQQLVELVVELVVEILCEKRDALKVSKKQLAARVGVSRTAIILMEGGRRRPSLELVIKLAGGLDLLFSTVVAEAEKRMAKELSRVRKARSKK